MIQGYRHPCGCVEGFYWCAKHDIYRKQNRKQDPRWTGDYDRYERNDEKPDGCSCHISAPCSFCTWDADHDET